MAPCLVVEPTYVRVLYLYSYDTPQLWSPDVYGPDELSSDTQWRVIDMKERDAAVSSRNRMRDLPHPG